VNLKNARDSGQTQTMLIERLKIRCVDRRQFCATTNRNRRDHAISQTSGAPAGLIE
jgi:hypothetical protein